MSSREVSCKSSSHQDDVVNLQAARATPQGSFYPTTYKSIGGNLYYLVIVDDFSHYTWVMFLGDKSETPEVFKTFTRRAQREYNSPIVKIQSDNGTEFKNMKIEEWCDEEGIKHEFSATIRLNKMEWWKERTKH